MSKEWGFMCTVLSKVLQTSEREWNAYVDREHERYRSISENYQRVGTRVNPESAESIKAIFKKACDDPSKLDGKIFYLPPFDIVSSLIPLLALDHESQKGFYVGLYGNRDADSQKSLGIGIRFEMGHPESRHCYPHVQFTCTPFKADSIDGMLECPDWVPESHPCVPSPAEDVFSLLLCLLATFYGTKIFVDLSDDAGIANLIKKRLWSMFELQIDELS